MSTLAWVLTATFFLAALFSCSSPKTSGRVSPTAGTRPTDGAGDTAVATEPVRGQPTAFEPTDGPAGPGGVAAG